MAIKEKIKYTLSAAERKRMKELEQKSKKEIPSFIEKPLTLIQMLQQKPGFLYWEGYGKYGERDYDER